MTGFTPEQELILVARGLVEIADGLAAEGTTFSGPGVAYARKLVADLDAGVRGVRESEQTPLAPLVRRASPPSPSSSRSGFSRSHGYTP
jgi:hypothetical protein